MSASTIATEKLEQATAGEQQAAFELLPDAAAALGGDFELRQRLLQWNLSDRLKLLRFRMRRRVASEEDERRLVSDFFQDSHAQALLGLPPSKELDQQHLTRLNVTVTSTSFLDRLITAGVAAADGSLRRCFDETFDGCSVSDLLREMLVNPDSQHSDLFSPVNDQNELFFKIFRALVIGGPLCQSDDKLQPYENATQALYKALVSVKKNAADKSAIDVTSHAYAVDRSSALFKNDSPFHSCFVIVDPKKRWLTVWYHQYVPFW